MAQRAIAIPPRLDGEQVASDPFWSKRRTPTIVGQRLHAQPTPLLLVGGAPEQFDREHLVAISKYLGFDDDRLADNALGGKASGVDARRHLVDDDAWRHRGLDDGRHTTAPLY